jgi:cation diffusion facilitator CzcD-associated flavoprotein CzcO
MSVGATPLPRVAVIGAGGGGIAMGATLRRIGVESFTIFEQSPDLGGTWLDNVYPGASVDTPLPFYSFSFSRYDFTGTHCAQPEILEYLRLTAKRFRLDSHFEFNTAVERCVWDEPAQCYHVFTSDGRERDFEVVVSAVGLLNQPAYPDWPGLSEFRGPKFHTSRWEHQHDLAGKRVAVVGTGSTAIQIVPAIAPIVGHLKVFQRQPGWLLPKGERVFSAVERARMTSPLGIKWARFQQWLAYERGFLKRPQVEGSRGNIAAQRACEAYIAKMFDERPDLAKLVTPAYPYGGKRLLKDSNFYPALKHENVELIPHGVIEVTETGIVDDANTEHEVDVLVLSTGFQAANFLATFDVVGRDGRSLHDVWDGDPFAYLGLTVPGFPNFYILYGPNTNGAPIMYLHELQVGFVASQLRRMMGSGVTSIEVRERVSTIFNNWLQKRLALGVVARHQDVHNYARGKSGRNVIGWNEGMTVYAAMCKLTPRLSSKARTVRRAAAN